MSWPPLLLKITINPFWGAPVPLTIVATSVLVGVGLPASMRTLINQYFADKGKYPADISSLVEDHYLQAIPKDPFTDSPDSWVMEQAEQDESDITTEAGIANVKSGAEGTSLDGRSYSEF